MSATARRARRIDLLRRCHLWTGLVAFTSLVVFAVAGLEVTLRPRAAAEPDAEVEERPFRVAGDLDDRRLADRVHAELALPLTRPIPDWALRRDRQHRLVLDFHTPNGLRRVTVLEEEGKLRIERRRTGLGQYLNVMHATTLSGAVPDLRVRLWAAYVDLSIFALLLLVVSGIWLWLETRPRLAWAWAVLTVGGGLFAGAWWLLR